MRSSPAPLAALAALAAVALATGCSSADASPAGPDREGEDELRARRGIQLVVTVDWEGSDLEEANLAAMESFRRRFPDVRLVQFLNAAYYTKPGANAASVTRQIQRGLGAKDERGLHIHGWKRLFEASGVRFLSTPNFWGTSYLSDSCAYDCGHEVPLTAYTTDDLRKVIRYSVKTLDGAGFGKATSFRCGGWVSAEPVQAALSAEGFRFEHSRVPSKFLQGEIGQLPLWRWVDALWTGTDELSQPSKLATSGLTELPDNGALADYVTADEMVQVFEANRDAFLRDRSRPRLVSIGFHQETAARFLPRLEEALARIFASGKAAGVPVTSVVSSGVTL
jgi:hypothetical protein